MISGSIFTGAGGWEIGARDAGVQPAWGVDIDPVACTYAQRNASVDVVCTDARHIRWQDMRRVDILFASPPCQAFSQAGRADRHNKSIGLVVLDAVSTLRPPLVLIENVIPFRRSNTFERLMIGLLNLNYAITRAHVNACYYGVAQSRKRLILVASLSGLKRISPPSGTAATWRAALDDLIPTMEHGEFAEWQAKKGIPQNGDIFVHGQDCRTNTRRIWRNADEPAYVVAASAAKGVARVRVDGVVRVVRTRENARLQSFPDWCEWPDKKTDASRLIGNAVPPRLSAAVLSQVL